MGFGIAVGGRVSRRIGENNSMDLGVTVLSFGDELAHGLIASDVISGAPASASGGQSTASNDDGSSAAMTGS